MKSIIYRSPIRGHGDELCSEPEVVYFGFVERIPLAELGAKSNDITAKLEAMQQPCVVDNVLHFPASDRPPERHEVFLTDSTDILIMVRVPFRPAPTVELNLN